MSIISEIHSLVKNDGLTIEQAVEQRVPGADPKYWRKRLENYSPAAPPKPRKKTKSRRSTYRSTRKWAAASILSTGSGFFSQREARGRATAELVDRVNSKDQVDKDGSDTETIFLNSYSNFQILEVVR
jgi:hypothetical protein